MTIEYFRFAYAGEKGGRDGTSKTRTLVYNAKASSPNDDYDDFYAAGPFGINSVFVHPRTRKIDPICTCQKVTAPPDPKGELVRKVTYEFSSISPPGGPKPPNNDPTMQLPRYVWRRDEKMKAIWRAKNKTGGPAPIVNSAGQFFRNALMVPKKIAVCTVTRNEYGYNAPLAARFWDTVNQAAFWGQPKGCALCAGILASKVWQRFGSGTLGYWEVSYEIHFIRPFFAADWYTEQGMAGGDGAPDDGTDGWVEVVPDFGSLFWKDGLQSTTQARPAQVRDVNGQATTQEQPLNGSGDLLPAEAIKRADFHYRYFWVRDYADFSLLNLPYPI